LFDKHCPRLEWAYFSFFPLPLPKTKAPILGDPGAASQVDKMSAAKAHCKIETGPRSPTPTEPVPEAPEPPTSDWSEKFSEEEHSFPH